MKIAYEKVSDENGSSPWSWKHPWKIKALPRTQSFIWTLCKGKILTKEQRQHRHMSDITECKIVVTTKRIWTIHSVCPNARNLWNKFTNPPKVFLNGPFPFFEWFKAKHSIKEQGYRRITMENHIRDLYMAFLEVDMLLLLWCELEFRSQPAETAQGFIRN